MKKLLSLILALSIIIVFSAGCGKNSTTSASSSKSNKINTLEAAKKKGVLVVGSSNDAPFAYIDKDTKQFSGIDADIIREVAKRLGIPKVEMKEVKFENLLLELNNKNIDLVTDGMYVKPERQKIARFTNIWYKEGEALIVPKNSTITGLNDLKDKVVGAQKGVAFLEMAQNLQKEGKIKQVDVFGSQAELLLATNTHKIDATITDGAVAAYSIQKDKSLQLKIVSPYTPQEAGNIAAAARKGDTALVDAINKELKILNENGFILKVLKKYGLNEDYYVPAAK